VNCGRLDAGADQVTHDAVGAVLRSLIDWNTGSRFTFGV
jgi:hypothetical protein